MKDLWIFRAEEGNIYLYSVPEGFECCQAAAELRVVAVGLAMLFASGCAANSGPPQLVRIAKPLFGGEALHIGTIEVRRGCVVAVDGEGRPATVLFDPDVTLVDGNAAIRDGRSGTVIRLGQKFHAGAAIVRENGKGWSLRDIEEFYGVKLPRTCLLICTES